MKNFRIRRKYDARQMIDVSMPNRKTPAAPTAVSQSTELQCELAIDIFEILFKKLTRRRLMQTVALIFV
jgi:hypothetical protein